MDNSKDIGRKLKTNLIYLFAILGGYSVFFYLNSLKFSKEVIFCPFKNLTGIPCPGCGMGRATIELVHGKIINSLMFHPLAIPFNVAVVVAVIWLLRDVFMKKDSFVNFVKSKPNRWIILGVFMVLLTVWGKNILLEI